MIAGCSMTPTIPTASYEEAILYEKVVSGNQITSGRGYITKWIQPSNKKSECKVFVGTSKTDDRTLDNDYKIFWDGECKDGYAFGLGREFEKGTLLEMEAIAIYPGGENQPDYYIQKYHLDGYTQEGLISKGYYVETRIDESNFDIDIRYLAGFFGRPEKPVRLIIKSTPFYDNKELFKYDRYIAYRLIDASSNEFDTRRYSYRLLNDKGKQHGYGLDTPKVGFTRSAEFVNGRLVRLVNLPISYYGHLSAIFEEIKKAGKNALIAQEKALKVKKKYLLNICGNNISVSFISNNEYKKICNESDYMAELKEKMDKKLAKIAEAKQKKREQLNQQKLINAQIELANAAHRQADAAARRAYAAEQANNDQFWQNSNQNLQMQQLNNKLNLMLMR